MGCSQRRPWPPPSRRRCDAANSNPACPGDDSGLVLPPGFCASIFADGIGHARHLAVLPTASSTSIPGRGYYGNDTPHAGGFLVALKDSSGEGKADVILRFGETCRAAARADRHRLYGALYAESNDQIVRYACRRAASCQRGRRNPS